MLTHPLSPKHLQQSRPPYQAHPGWKRELRPHRLPSDDHDRLTPMQTRRRFRDWRCRSGKCSPMPRHEIYHAPRNAPNVPHENTGNRHLLKHVASCIVKAADFASQYGKGHSAPLQSIAETPDRERRTSSTLTQHETCTNEKSRRAIPPATSPSKYRSCTTHFLVVHREFYSIDRSFDQKPPTTIPHQRHGAGRSRTSRMTSICNKDLYG